MKLILPLTMTVALFAGQAMAECVVPANNTVVPNGSKATKDEMIAAQRGVRAFDADVKAYGECLKTEQDAELAAAGEKLSDEQREKIVNRYAQKSNAAVDKVQKLADQFNAELKAFKAKNPS